MLGVVSVPTVTTSFVLQLMQDLGVIHQAGSGSYHLLPLGERSLQKLIRIVDDEMGKINAQKLLMPLLTSGDLWKSTGMTGRLMNVGEVHQSDKNSAHQKLLHQRNNVYTSVAITVHGSTHSKVHYSTCLSHTSLLYFHQYSGNSF
jgi:hypothetical protein